MVDDSTQWNFLYSDGMLYVWIVLRHVLRIVPNLLMMWLIWPTLKTIQALEHAPYQPDTLQNVQKLGQQCKNVIIIIVLMVPVINLADLFLAKWLPLNNLEFYLPVVAIPLLLFILLFTRKIAENQELKTDNDSFI
ncbi:MAG: hypothetical protein K6G65_09275 [Lachnospiraceae bacterium]|nr:hypothetical protein [Lachnospiraceae bacterium]